MLIKYVKFLALISILSLSQQSFASELVGCEPTTKPNNFTILGFFEKLLSPITELVFDLNTSRTGIVLTLNPIFFNILQSDPRYFLYNVMQSFLLFKYSNPKYLEVNL